MGGPHVTFMPEEALEHCDYVLRGEADDLIVDFVQRLDAGESLESFPSLSWKRGGTAVHNPDAVQCPDVDHLPTQDLGLIAGYDARPSAGSGIDGITTWNASDAFPPCAVGLVSGSMIFSCSMIEPGHPCVTMSGNAFVCFERT